MEIVRDGLPPLPSVATGLFAREGLNLRRLAPFVRILQDALAPKPSRQSLVRLRQLGRRRPPLASAERVGGRSSKSLQIES